MNVDIIIVLFVNCINYLYIIELFTFLMADHPVKIFAKHFFLHNYFIHFIKFMTFIHFFAKKFQIRFLSKNFTFLQIRFKNFKNL